MFIIVIIGYVIRIVMALIYVYFLLLTVNNIYPENQSMVIKAENAYRFILIGGIITRHSIIGTLYLGYITYKRYNDMKNKENSLEEYKKRVQSGSFDIMNEVEVHTKDGINGDINWLGLVLTLLLFIV